MTYYLSSQLHRLVLWKSFQPSRPRFLLTLEPQQQGFHWGPLARSLDLCPWAQVGLWPSLSPEAVPISVQCIIT